MIIWIDWMRYCQIVVYIWTILFSKHDCNKMFFQIKTKHYMLRNIFFCLISLWDPEAPVVLLFISTRINPVRISCTLPSQPENGKWSIIGGSTPPENRVSINTILKYECNAGYKLSSPTPYVICDQNWDASRLPECESKWKY